MRIKCIFLLCKYDRTSLAVTATCYEYVMQFWKHATLIFNMHFSGHGPQTPAWAEHTTKKQEIFKEQMYYINSVCAFVDLCCDNCLRVSPIQSTQQYHGFITKQQKKPYILINKQRAHSNRLQFRTHCSLIRYLFVCLFTFPGLCDCCVCTILSSLLSWWMSFFFENKLVYHSLIGQQIWQRDHKSIRMTQYSRL